MSADVCGFALHRGRFCMRPAGHEKSDGRVTRHDSTGWGQRMSTAPIYDALTAETFAAQLANLPETEETP